MRDFVEQVAAMRERRGKMRWSTKIWGKRKASHEQWPRRFNGFGIDGILFYLNILMDFLINLYNFIIILYVRIFKTIAE